MLNDMQTVANGAQRMKSVGEGVRLISSAPEDVAAFAEEGTLTSDTIVFNPLAFEIMAGNAEMLRIILSEEKWDLRYSCMSLAGGNIPTDQYPLITLAARRGECACIEELLSHRADIDSVAYSADGTRQRVGTPLMVAIEHEQPKAAALLIARRADPNAIDPAQNTPLHLAAMFDDIFTLPLLAQADADLAAANMNGRTALHFAIQREKPRAITWLLERGVPLKEADRFDETPLHYAVKIGSKAAAHVLIERGATCLARCQKCTLQTKLVQRAIAKSAEKRAETEARARTLAMITPGDLRRAQEVATALLAAEEELLRQEQERADQKRKSKAQKAAGKKQRQKLKELRETLTALRDPASDGFTLAVERGKQLSRSAFQSRFEEDASERFIEQLSFGGGASNTNLDGEDGVLTQEEIDSWLANFPTSSRNRPDFGADSLDED